MADPEARGAEMFARYAYAPNALGYCGPPLGATLRDGSVDEVRRAATRFSGAWPYLRVLSELTGIADPLDYRLVESYWLGGGVGAELDPQDFFDALLAIIGPQAGRYWSHLTPDLACEAAGNHCFHVFGVYPWTRFLGRGMDEHPLSVLDNCRITWGTVDSVTGDRVEVLCEKLAGMVGHSRCPTRRRARSTSGPTATARCPMWPSATRSRCTGAGCAAGCHRSRFARWPTAPTVSCG